MPRLMVEIAPVFKVEKQLNTFYILYSSNYFFSKQKYNEVLFFRSFLSVYFDLFHNGLHALSFSS